MGGGSMFTGLIEEIGKVKGIRQHGEVMLMTISASNILQDAAIGDSISVNGVCLTVTAYSQREFTADVMPETFRKSSLSTLRNGQTVNLERAMLAGGRFGGHIVQGHVDSTGKIIARYEDGNAIVFEIELSIRSGMKYMIPKGSITIDGISLTIVDTTDTTVKVSIIPHTLAQTALQHRQVGDQVNIEADIIGKYVEHLLSYRGEQQQSSKSSVSTSFLAEHGFI